MFYSAFTQPSAFASLCFDKVRRYASIKKAVSNFSVVLNGGITKVQKPQIDFLRFLCYNRGIDIQENEELIKSLLLWEKGDRVSGG